MAWIAHDSCREPADDQQTYVVKAGKDLAIRNKCKRLELLLLHLLQVSTTAANCICRLEALATSAHDGQRTCPQPQSTLLKHFLVLSGWRSCFRIRSLTTSESGILSILWPPSNSPVTFLRVFATRFLYLPQRTSPNLDNAF